MKFEINVLFAVAHSAHYYTRCSMCMYAYVLYTVKRAARRVCGVYKNFV
jgi:hypothetical protein